MAASRALALGALFAIAIGTSVGSPRPQLNAIAVVSKGTTHEFWKSVHAGAKRAGEERHIPLVTFDSDLASDDKISFVATDNFHGGQLLFPDYEKWLKE